MNWEEIGKRIRSTRIQAGYTLKELGERVGRFKSDGIKVSHVTIRNWEGGSEIKADNLDALCKALSVSLDWIKTGINSISEPNATYSATSIIGWDDISDLPSNEFIFIPRYDVHVSAGNGSTIHWDEIEKEHPQAFRNEFISSNGFDVKLLKVIYAKGDSMEPRIFDGDSLTINTAQPDIVNEKYYVIRIDDDIFVKKLRKRPAGGLEIISLNPAYDTMSLNAEEAQCVQVIGRVIQISSMGEL